MDFITNSIYYFLDFNNNLIDTGIYANIKYFPQHNGYQWISCPLQAHNKALNWLTNNNYNMNNYIFENVTSYLNDNKLVFTIRPKNDKKTIIISL